MAKKKSKGDKLDTAAPSALDHKPFASLGGLSSSLPEAKPAPSAKTEQAPPVAAAPRFGKLVVRMEKKGRGGKTVTRVSGVDRAKLAELAKEMKKALGCGAVVEGDDLLLLGSLVERAAGWLEAAGASKVVRGN